MIVEHSFEIREREERLAVLNAQHQLHIQELQKKIQQKVRTSLYHQHVHPTIT